MRNEISYLEHMKSGTLRNTKGKERSTKKYRVEVEIIAEIVEMLKQRVTSTIRKIKRYEARCQQFTRFNSN